MAKYFIDTEFHESKKPIKVLGITIKEIWTIELISIGIVCNDGREYYSINKEFNVKDAWYSNQGTKEKPNYWLRENVLKPLIVDKELQNTGKELVKRCITINTCKKFINKYGKSNKQIAEEIKNFVYGGCECSNDIEKWGKNMPIEFYGYYADYDYVLFSWLFGGIQNYPSDFPMYYKDLKQMMDDKGLNEEWKNKKCPDPEGEHNALIDAKWNKKLYDKIINHI